MGVGGEQDDRGQQTRAVRLQLWDIAGQDRFARLTRAYFRRAKAACVVCDVTRENTFEAVLQWKQELDRFSQEQSERCSPLPVVLFANKSDMLTDAPESFELGAKMERLCREHGFAAWYISSGESGHLALLHTFLSLPRLPLPYLLCNIPHLRTPLVLTL